jgi:hypothetical protein
VVAQTVVKLQVAPATGQITGGRAAVAGMFAQRQATEVESTTIHVVAICFTEEEARASYANWPGKSSTDELMVVEKPFGAIEATASNGNGALHPCIVCGRPGLGLTSTRCPQCQADFFRQCRALDRPDADDERPMTLR